MIQKGFSDKNNNIILVISDLESKKSYLENLEHYMRRDRD